MKGDTSLLVLSAGWLVLCTGLVVKHWELLTVFMAFLGSFVLAFLLDVLQQVQPGNQNKPQRIEIRHKVGVLVHSLALAYLSCHTQVLPWLLPCFPLVSSVSAEFVALSLATGYLAFDHWYTAMYCSPKTLGRVTHDALSLSLLAIILSVTSDTVLSHYRTLTAAWLVHQIVRQSSAPPTKSVVVPSTSLVNTTITAAAAATTTSHKVLPLTPDLWYIHGQAYDLQPFLDRHPGGSEALRLGQGRDDCTALVLSYHSFSLAHVQTILAKYRVNSTATPKKGKKSRALTSDKFYNVLCERVAQTLQAQGLDPHKDRAASWWRVCYYALVATGVVVSGYYHLQANLVGSFCFAVTGWLIGALGHDSGHFAASRYAWLNNVGVWGMSLLCNPIMWQHQHTYAHHSFTNDFEADPDLHHFHTLLRVHRRFQHADIYRNQTFLPFVVLAYALVVFGECIWIPLGMLREGTLYGIVEWTDRKRPWRAFAMVAHLLTYAALILIAPLWVTSTWYHGLACVVVHVTTAGLLFGFFSQINHLNEQSVEIDSHKTQRHPATLGSWAATQVETSNNFCPDSTLWYYLSNGLNLQIEHHLFPGLNHCHLWRIAPVVKATCEEYGVNYKCWDTWGDLWMATRAWLDKLSGNTDVDCGVCEPQKM